jgi:hypothetical protein
MNNWMSVATAGLSILLFVLAALTAFAIVSGQPTAAIGSSAGAGCLVLLGLTLAAGFVGYALPWDAFSVTATGIGFGLARSIPLAG